MVCVTIALEGVSPKMTIMIVDDDVTYLGLLSEVLFLQGFEVIPAHDGEEALSRLRDSPVDFILSDIGMPGMDGVELHKHVRQDPNLKDLPFAWNTGYRELRNSVEVEDPGIDLKFDKTMPVPHLLFFLNHFARQREERTGRRRVAFC
jgi:CheY-like chemotaxis protein